MTDFFAEFPILHTAVTDCFTEQIRRRGPLNCISMEEETTNTSLLVDVGESNQLPNVILVGAKHARGSAKRRTWYVDLFFGHRRDSHVPIHIDSARPGIQRNWQLERIC